LGSDARRHTATEGTAPTSEAAVRPLTCKNRKNERSLVAVAFAEVTFTRWDSAATNSMITAALSTSRSSSPPAGLAKDKNRRATSR
jgi:hypothetical protein